MSNRNKKLLLLLVILSTGLISILLYLYQIKYASPVKQVPTDTEVFQVKGIVRLVSVWEPSTYLVSGSSYILTDLSSNSGFLPQAVYISSELNPKIGTCSQITVSYKKPSIQTLDQIRGKMSYEVNQLLNLKVSSLKQLPLDDCSEVSSNFDRAYSSSDKLFKVTGTLEHITRPESDINYDYVLNTDYELVGLEGGSGLPQKNTVVMPSSWEIFKKMEALVGKKVIVSGYREWGFAESTFLLVTEISNDSR